MYFVRCVFLACFSNNNLSFYKDLSRHVRKKGETTRHIRIEFACTALDVLQRCISTVVFYPCSCEHVSSGPWDLCCVSQAVFELGRRWRQHILRVNLLRAFCALIVVIHVVQLPYFTCGVVAVSMTLYRRVVCSGCYTVCPCADSSHDRRRTAIALGDLLAAILILRPVALCDKMKTG